MLGRMERSLRTRLRGADRGRGGCDSQVGLSHELDRFPCLPSPSLGFCHNVQSEAGPGPAKTVHGPFHFLLRFLNCRQESAAFVTQLRFKLVVSKEKRHASEQGSDKVAGDAPPTPLCQQRHHRRHPEHHDAIESRRLWTYGTEVTRTAKRHPAEARHYRELSCRLHMHHLVPRKERTNRRISIAVQRLPHFLQHVPLHPFQRHDTPENIYHVSFCTYEPSPFSGSR